MEEWYIPWFGQVTIAGQQYSTYSSEPMTPGAAILCLSIFMPRKSGWIGRVTVVTDTGMCAR